MIKIRLGTGVHRVRKNNLKMRFLGVKLEIFIFFLLIDHDPVYDVTGIHMLWKGS